MAKTIEKYGMLWDAALEPLAIEMQCIRMGGKWKRADGTFAGMGLPYHFEAMRKILWPQLDDHRWNSLCRDTILSSKVTVLFGPGSSSKTHTAAWVSLCDYYCFPKTTCVLVSSTDLRGLELRIWGEIKMLHEQATAKSDLIPGFLIDSKHCISTDELEEGVVRDLRKGIIGIPCIQNGKFIGLGKYAGIKQKRMRLVGDELQFMGGSFLSSFANLDKNEDFRAIILGNPNDIMDPLGRAAEPLDGWDTHMEPEKTSVWETRFMNGKCVNLVGTDSPNFDFPPDKPTRYRYLISREKIANTASFFSQDSQEFYSQCKGVMKIGTLARRVITRELCRKFGALEKVVWMGTSTTKIGALDSAYGGDRCVLGHIEFGLDVNRKMVININPITLVPIRVTSGELPEEQIAKFCKKYCESNGVTPENFFHDSTGRGSLGTFLSREWSPMTNPVEFGGAPTKRPVSLDIFTNDPQTGLRRLKLASEHYVKFVTELWFAVRYAIEAGQIRNLPEDMMEEGCMREYDRVKDDKIEIESKSEMKERIGRSPDLMDWAAIATEGARRRGFQISKLANESEETNRLDWFRDLQRKSAESREKHALNFHA